ncbi:hypothetical protein [Nostoc sp.]|uniref:hypothetical protein n=1 Tax=Nostoc sp. TaxID=1180 RepID=UPI002FF806EA
MALSGDKGQWGLGTGEMGKNNQYNSSLREAAPRRGWRLGRSYAAGFTAPFGNS